MYRFISETISLIAISDRDQVWSEDLNYQLVEAL